MSAMLVAILILQVLAFVCFLIASLQPTPPPPRVNFIAVGLAAWVLSVILGDFHH